MRSRTLYWIKIIIFWQRLFIQANVRNTLFWWFVYLKRTLVWLLFYFILLLCLLSLYFNDMWRDITFSHMRLRKPTGSLVLDRSIRDGDLARGIRALSCKSKQSNASPIVCIVSLRRWPWRYNTNAIFPATSKLRLAVVAVALHRS